MNSGLFCQASQPVCLPGSGLTVCLFICLPVCLSVCLSLCLTHHLSVCLPVCLCVYLSVCLPDCPSVCLSVCLTDHLSVCLPPSVCLSVCLPACTSVYQSACLVYRKAQWAKVKARKRLRRTWKTRQQQKRKSIASYRHTNITRHLTRWQSVGSSVGGSLVAEVNTLHCTTLRTALRHGRGANMFRALGRRRPAGRLDSTLIQTLSHSWPVAWGGV